MKIGKLCPFVLVIALVFLAGCSDNDLPPGLSVAEGVSTSAPEEAVTEAAVVDSPVVPQAAVPRSDSASAYAGLFAKDQISAVSIELSDTDWKAMLADPLAEAYYSGTVTVNGVTIENVGVRFKGNSTLKSVAKTDSERYSFRIKFDKYVDGQNLMGLDELCLNNNHGDPSYMREYLCYEGLRAIGEAVPMTSYTNVSVNGKLHGLYLCVEAMDDSLLERVFGDNEGNLYKADLQSTLVYQEGSAYDTLEQKNGKDTSREDIKGLVQVLNAMPTGEKGEIESVLDVNSALRYFAANTAFGSYDSYSGGRAQNYYLCQNNGVFTVLPWDYNVTFSGDSIGVPIDKPVYGSGTEQRPMITNLLAVPEYRERYYGYLRELAVWMDGLEARTQELADILRPHVEVDPTKFYTIAQFEEQLNVNTAAASGSTGGRSKDTGSLLAYGVQRRENIKGQLTGVS